MKVQMLCHCNKIANVPKLHRAMITLAHRVERNRSSVIILCRKHRMSVLAQVNKCKEPIMLEGLYRLLEHVPGHLRLRDKSCLVVGAGTDVAATIARVFAAEGCKILAVDENEQTIRMLVNLIQEEGGFATSCHATTRSPEELERCLSNHHFLQPDILIDNWSARPLRIDGRFTCPPVLEGAEGFDPCRNWIHVLAARSSDAMSSAPPSKSGTFTIDTSLADTFARILAKNGASNSVRVNTVCFGREPEPVSSEYFFAEDAGSADEHQPNVDHASLRLQVAYAALFLASDEASFVNGARISIDDDESGGKAL
jgi:NAD(P)-dependent dehydrogenase (short-subunit alcohol dehydrogenase family)